MSYGSPEWRPWVKDPAEARPFLRRAVEAGINFFDTADMYSKGASEEVVGSTLHDLMPRDELVIATKLFFPLRDQGANRQGLSRKRVLDCVDASLRRLRTDYIDLYQIHRYDRHTPIEETLEALDSCVRAGKVRYLGASSMFAWQFARMLFGADLQGLHRFVSMQNHYNLVYRDEEREMLPLCRAEGVGVIPYSPLGRGFLAGTRTRESWETTLRARTDQFSSKDAMRDCDFEVQARVVALAEKRGMKPAQIALAWLLHREDVTSPIVGATRVEQLDEAVAAVELSLDETERQQLEEPYQPRPDRGFF
jgi:aryl-alcohol dehydrogenase (NADP+)